MMMFKHLDVKVNIIRVTENTSSGDNADTGADTAVLGKAILGQMVLGRE